MKVLMNGKNYASVDTSMLSRKSEIGNLNNLTTDQKGSIVEAINSLNIVGSNSVKIVNELPTLGEIDCLYIVNKNRYVLVARYWGKDLTILFNENGINTMENATSMTLGSVGSKPTTTISGDNITLVVAMDDVTDSDIEQYGKLYEDDPVGLKNVICKIYDSVDKKYLYLYKSVYEETIVDSDLALYFYDGSEFVKIFPAGGSLPLAGGTMTGDILFDNRGIKGDNVNPLYIQSARASSNGANLYLYGIYCSTNPGGFTLDANGYELKGTKSGDLTWGQHALNVRPKAICYNMSTYSSTSYMKIGTLKADGLTGYVTIMLGVYSENGARYSRVILNYYVARNAISLKKLGFLESTGTVETDKVVVNVKTDGTADIYIKHASQNTEIVEFESLVSDVEGISYNDVIGSWTNYNTSNTTLPTTGNNYKTTA